MSKVESTLDAQIKKAIHKHPQLRRNLRFETHDGRIVLKGTVTSFYQKQIAQEAVRRLEGIHHIDNHLEVNWV